MSIYFSGARTRSRGLVSAIAKALRSFTLKPVKKITLKIDPFNVNVKETREFLYYISAPKILATNPNCKIKTDVVCDRSLPQITFNLESGNNVIMKSAHLTSLNILQLYNKHISSLHTFEQEEPEEGPKILKKKKQRKNLRKLRGRKGNRRRTVNLLG